MGRRKIEIQPITHERNRSVTFLKRKNGLFKKAYELGVLCSVDVAVIIFEEKPGHNVKLYQYGSDDVKSLVQRHTRYDGERDTKGPLDFGSSKPDDAGDLEEDEVDEEEDIASRPRKRAESTVTKPSSSSASKSRPDVKMEADTSNRIIQIQPSSQNVSRPTMSPHSTSPVSLPTSGERSSRRTPPETEDLPTSSKRARRESYSRDAASVPGRNALLNTHPTHHYSQSSQQAFGHTTANPPFNAFFNNPPIGGQSGHVLDFLRNPANMRAMGSYAPRTQGGNTFPARHPPGVSEAFLASLSEVASQQGGPGCGIGGVGGGMNGFEWPAGYPLQAQHDGDQSAETSWLDFLTGGPQASTNIPPPAHLPHHPHAHNHHQWSSASSESSHRSDSRMSNSGGGLSLGLGGIRTSINGQTRSSSTDIMNNVL